MVSELLESSLEHRHGNHETQLRAAFTVTTETHTRGFSSSRWTAEPNRIIRGARIYSQSTDVHVRSDSDQIHASL